jgi:hypothetical protein
MLCRWDHTFLVEDTNCLLWDWRLEHVHRDPWYRWQFLMVSLKLLRL